MFSRRGKTLSVKCLTGKTIPARIRRHCTHCCQEGECRNRLRIFWSNYRRIRCLLSTSKKTLSKLSRRRVSRDERPTSSGSPTSAHGGTVLQKYVCKTGSSQT